MRRRDKDKPEEFMTLRNCRLLKESEMKYKSVEYKRAYFQLFSKAKYRVLSIERIKLNYPKEYNDSLKKEYSRLKNFLQTEYELKYKKVT